MKTTILFITLAVSTSIQAQNKIVIGSDTRERITESNHRRLHDSIGLLHIVTDKSSGTCTGTVVGTKHVVTAAHCVVREGKFVKTVTFYPGINDNIKLKKFPFGSFKTSRFQVLKSYLTAPDTSNDLALITFDENLPVPALPIAAAPKLGNLSIIISGYPGDKTTGTLWEGKGNRDGLNRTTTLAHNVDTAPGQSGSAVRAKVNGVESVIGVHSCGNRYNNIVFNSAYFFSAETIRILKSWMAKY